ncbi:MAG: hypothetical protein AVDCRST_MAG70-1583 [uncultured Thermomicrobiales bacterium]|uniref:Uncharacterized protein n=1 Tax=uncultured Thermomicrobiales bacterium TaxID=1645740 RepID=A0A6J4UU46_9BACT|nr:MAG: hypothetical protein AVDCRST_MAG70-1583 [uncultured Thermomicrobiales bacterium]
MSIGSCGRAAGLLRARTGCAGHRRSTYPQRRTAIQACHPYVCQDPPDGVFILGTTLRSRSSVRP